MQARVRALVWERQSPGKLASGRYCRPGKVRPGVQKSERRNAAELNTQNADLGISKELKKVWTLECP